MIGRVLVVDDEISISQLLARSLESRGFSCDQANGVDEAREKLQSTDYDVLLTDKNMPCAETSDEGGLELIRWARKYRPDLAILVMTGYPTVDSAVEALKLGAFDYLIKPLNLTVVVRKVERLCGYRRFVNSSQILQMCLNLNRHILEAGGTQDPEFEGRFKQVQDLLDGMFFMFRSTERALLDHRQRMAEIAALAQQRCDETNQDDPARIMLRQIAEIASQRI